jgi:hypothetical protein
MIAIAHSDAQSQKQIEESIGTWSSKSMSYYWLSYRGNWTGRASSEPIGAKASVVQLLYVFRIAETSVPCA